ncbi:sensor histidine kinase [Paenibacillus rhizoplanae]
MKTQQFQTIMHGESRDEIGQLTLEFNSMIMQIKALINDVYLTEIQKKSLELERRKAQLNALQSQINPHFLFNALETIRMRSLLKQENETAKIIQSMAMILRSSLTWNKEWVSVEEELGFILCFSGYSEIPVRG